jgi:hypothetical protein
MFPEFRKLKTELTEEGYFRLFAENEKRKRKQLFVAANGI